MLEAINKENEKVYLASQAFATFAEPKEMEWVCKNCNEEVSLVKDYLRIHESGEVWVTSHFSHKPQSSCSRSGESERHHSRKKSVLNQLYSEKIPVVVGNSILRLKKEDIEGVEEYREGRRADILIEFENKDKFFGAGIAIEIVDSESMDSINEKIISWTENGYSFTFFNSSDFNGTKLKDGLVEVKYPFLSAVGKSFEELYNNIRDKISTIEDLDFNAEFLKKYEKEFTCPKCKHASLDKDMGNNYTGFFACWKDVEEGNPPRGKFKSSHTCDDFQPRWKDEDLLEILREKTKNEKYIDGGD